MARTLPYLYQRYVIAGKPLGGFRHWSEKFMGSMRPEADIAEFLHDEFGIDVVEIDRYSLNNVREDVTRSVVEYWNEVHSRRRAEPGDEIIA